MIFLCGALCDGDLQPMVIHSDNGFLCDTFCANYFCVGVHGVICGDNNLRHSCSSTVSVSLCGEVYFEIAPTSKLKDRIRNGECRYVEA